MTEVDDEVESVGANNGLDPNFTKPSETTNTFQRKPQQQHAIPTKKNETHKSENITRILILYIMVNVLFQPLIIFVLNVSMFQLNNETTFMTNGNAITQQIHTRTTKKQQQQQTRQPQQQ